MPSLDKKLSDRLDSLMASHVVPASRRVDGDGEFPSAALAALGDAGLLGAVSSPDVGGLGLGPRGASEIVERIARECGSTAMVVTMHFSGTAVLEAHAPAEIRRAAARGRHLSTLAFSESGSRSHFWAPTSTATRTPEGIRLDARKTMVTSAHHAAAYVWSSRPVEAEGASTLWLVPTDAAGLGRAAGFDGLGLRGNDSSPVIADGVVLPESARLGEDGAGLGIMLGTVLPLFNVLESAVSCGLMEGGIRRTIAHVTSMRYEHSDSALSDLPTVRANIARMRCGADAARALLLDTLSALEAGRADATLRVLECKAVASEAANEVLDLAMRTCGGMAFRKDVGVERMFRDARASGVMGPTTDVLYDFIGKAACGLPLF